MNRYGMNVITLDGDKVDRKGALSGGFHDVRRSRLQAAEQLQRWSTTLSTENNRLAEVRRTLVKLDQQVTQSLSRKMQAETKLAKLQDGRAPILASATTLREDLGREEARLQRLEKALQSIDNDISGSKTQLEALREEIQQPMVQSLSAEEMDTLTDLSKTIERTKSDLAMLSKERTSVSSTIFFFSPDGLADPLCFAA